MNNPQTLDAASVELFGSETPTKKPLGLIAIMLLTLLVVALGFGGWFGWQTYQKLRNPKMYFINAFDVPMKVKIGDQTIELKGREFDSRVMVPGSYDLAVTDGSGNQIATEKVDVPEFTDVVAYNIGGVALLRESTVTFRKDRSVKTDPEEVSSPLGETFITRDDVEWSFESPTKEISVRGTPPPTTERQKFFGFPGQLDSQVPWQWEGTVGYLLVYQQKPAEALKALLKVASIDSKNSRIRTAAHKIWANCTTYKDFPFVTDPKCGSFLDLVGIAVKSGQFEPEPPAPPVDVVNGSGEAAAPQQ